MYIITTNTIADRFENENSSSFMVKPKTSGAQHHGRNRITQYACRRENNEHSWTRNGAGEKTVLCFSYCCTCRRFPLRTQQSTRGNIWAASSPLTVTNLWSITYLPLIDNWYNDVFSLFPSSWCAYHCSAYLAGPLVFACRYFFAYTFALSPRSLGCFRPRCGKQLISSVQSTTSTIVPVSGHHCLSHSKRLLPAQESLPNFKYNRKLIPHEFGRWLAYKWGPLIPLEHTFQIRSNVLDTLFVAWLAFLSGEDVSEKIVYTVRPCEALRSLRIAVS